MVTTKPMAPASVVLQKPWSPARSVAMSSESIRAHDNRVEEYPDLSDQIVGRINRLTFFWLWLASVVVAIILTAMVDQGGLAIPTFSPLNLHSQTTTNPLRY